MDFAKDSIYDLAIVGAGVTGASIARAMSRYRLRICLIDKEVDVSFGTSKANSGIIHAGIHSPPGSLKAELECLGNREFDRLSEELGFPFERRGELMVAFTDDEIEILGRYYRRGLDNGVRGLEILGREKTLTLEPSLNPDIRGSLFAPSAGIIGPYEYCFALVENAVANGVELFLQHRIVSLSKCSDGILEIESDRGGKFRTRFVVNCAGLYADEIADLAGAGTFRINPRKGEEYLLDRRVGSLVRRIIFPVPSPSSKGMLVIPTVDGPVMVGPTAVDVASKTDFATTSVGLETVFKHAQKMVPSIRLHDIITSFTGLRPVADGNDFIIGKTALKGFINAAGIQSPGLTASPAIAEKVRKILCDEGLRLDEKSDFNPRRERVPKIRPLVENREYGEVRSLIQKDRRYSKLVCRCENITEAEVVAAVRRGHTTLDGIKFSSRAGTGRCQGGFCTSRILAIIARETGMPVEKITKKGRGSEILKRGRRTKT